MENTTTNYSTILISVLMAVVIIATVMMPIITATTQTTTTTEIDNEGGGWLKLGYNEGADYSFNVGYETITVDEVETEIFKVGEQTGDYENMICYADPQRTLFISGDNWYLLTKEESPSVYKFTDTASVSNISGTLTINDGSTVIYSGISPTWAYIPDSAGMYGFFTNGGLNLEEGKPKVAVGSYAGVFAYNDTVVAPDDLGTLGLVKSGDYADGVVTWVVPDPESIDENTEETPLNANYESDSVIGSNGGNNISLRSADPTKGTQVGDLYYTFSRTKATIVGYSSSTDWSTFSFPDTVTYNDTTYNITKIDDSAFYDCRGIRATSLPAGVTYIGSYAFRGCTNLALTSLPDGLTTLSAHAFDSCSNIRLTSLPAGVTTIDESVFEGCTHLSLTSLPAGVTSIGKKAFYGCNDLALTSLPENLTSIGSNAFQFCTGLKSLVIPSSPTIGTYVFSGCNGLKQILNMGETEITTTSYGLNADSVQDYVSALGYIAPVSIHETVIVEDTSLSATLLKLLPVFMVLAVVIFIAYAMYRPDSEFVQSLKNKL